MRLYNSYNFGVAIKFEVWSELNSIVSRLVLDFISIIWQAILYAFAECHLTIWYYISVDCSVQWWAHYKARTRR